ncbi:MAG: DnaJ domain-containing protein [Acidobacteriota bacterium]
MTLIEIIRSLFLASADGVAVTKGERRRDLFVRRGGWYLDRDHDRAGEVVARLGDDAVRERPWTDAILVRLVDELAAELPGPATPADQRPLSGGVELVGPLPTAALLLALTGRGSNRDLLTILGGRDTKLKARHDTPAMQQLGGLDPDMARLLTTLDRPATVEQVERNGDRSRSLMALARLWAVGLAEPLIERITTSGTVLTPKAYERFVERMASSLVAEPLTIGADEHRARIAERWQRLSELDHYQLLEVSPGADEATVHAAYRALAREVHPLHANRLGQSLARTLELLFEGATEAYLVLSEPRRRASYNTMAGIVNRGGAEVDAEQREEEKKAMARNLVRRASSAASTMDYSTAVDLFKEAARLDPKPETWARLAQIQAKNPNWRRQAVESYRHALAMQPKDSALCVACAEVLEAMDDPRAARELYERALRVEPGHAVARQALDRLGGAKMAAR